MSSVQTDWYHMFLSQKIIICCMINIFTQYFMCCQISFFTFLLKVSMFPLLYFPSHWNILKALPWKPIYLGIKNLHLRIRHFPLTSSKVNNRNWMSEICSSVWSVNNRDNRTMLMTPGCKLQFIYKSCLLTSLCYI